MTAQPSRRAVFLDRDGVINVDTAYCSRREDFQWIPGVLEAAARYAEAGYQLVIVTNQSGIGTRVLLGTDAVAVPKMVPEATHVSRSLATAAEEGIGLAT